MELQTVSNQVTPHHQIVQMVMVRISQVLTPLVMLRLLHYLRRFAVMISRSLMEDQHPNVLTQLILPGILHKITK